MPITPRPTDTLTPDNLLIGMPVVDIALKTSPGVFGAYRSLGIIDSAAIQKTIETVILNRSDSGIEQKVRELVRKFDGALNVTVFKHDIENMRLLMAAADDPVALASGSVAVANEAVTLPALGVSGWSDLANFGVTSPATSVDPDTITDENVGTGDGTLGDASGDYSLDFKPLIVGDVSAVTVAGVTYAPVAVGAAATLLEVEVVVGTGATSGDLQFFSAGGAVDATGAILATYLPTHTLVENTDYVIDYLDGRIRPIIGASLPLKASQPVLVDYSYVSPGGNSLIPYTQFIFEAKLRIRQLSDVGINLDWVVPLVNARLTDTDLAWNRDEFTTSELLINFVDDGTATPFGTINIYDEPTATP